MDYLLTLTPNIAQLCTEDPVCVSRQFSSKFHAFFKTVIIKGEVLGKVTNYYLKKRVPNTWCSTLSCPFVDRGGPCHRHRPIRECSVLDPGENYLPYSRLDNKP